MAGLDIDLTGASGNLITTSPSGDITSTPITLGKFPRIGVTSDPTTEATQGWCYATCDTINVAGLWTEQMQIILADNEPLNGPVVRFQVSRNLASS